MSATLGALAPWFYIDASANVWGPFTIADRDGLERDLPSSATHDWRLAVGRVTR